MVQANTCTPYHIYPRAPILYIFVLFASPKTPNFVLRFYTFSHFIPTFPKILVLLFYTTMPESLGWEVFYSLGLQENVEKFCPNSQVNRHLDTVTV